VTHNKRNVIEKLVQLFRSIDDNVKSLLKVVFDDKFARQKY